MICIELTTLAYLPPFDRVELVTDRDDWNQPIQGQYLPGRWRFELDGERYANGFRCKFLLNGEIWSQNIRNEHPYYEASAGGNLAIPAQNPATHVVSLRQTPFARPKQPRIELGSVQSTLFDVTLPDPIDRVPYDVIVIGSGMGGGVVADQLADLGWDTLVLEAGGVPLETHIANLPRGHELGKTEVNKHVWGRWGEYQIENYDTPSDPAENQYRGAQGFNLGGRSVFWGGFIPRMSSWELDFWPRQVKWDLEDRYYRLAEQLMGRSVAPVTGYTREVRNKFREVFSDLGLDYTHFDAPMAVQRTPASGNTIAAGMFSTADLLLESARTNSPVGSQNLTVRTHHQAVRVEPGSTCRVIARDLVTKEERSFRAKFVVVACGCLESARLLKRSQLGGDLVGQGVTDHPIAFTHFYIPPTSPFYERRATVKQVSQPVEVAGQDRDSFNVLLELGADFNQGRFLDPEILQTHLQQRNMLCEIVFLFNRELRLTNSLEFQEDRAFRPLVRLRELHLNDHEDKRVQQIVDSVLSALGGVRIQSGMGGPGGVAHEVGSLRMAVGESNRIPDRQSSLPGVVDSDCRLLDQHNIFACDLSVFPTSPAANPSLTLVALALRLSDHLSELLS